MKKIAIIVLHYNNNTDTLLCLNSLRKMIMPSGFSKQILIIDNNSNTDLFEKKKKELQDVTLIQNEKNLGYAGGNNKGIRYALKHNFEHILIINNDTEVDKNLLFCMISMLESDKQIGIVIPKIYFSKGFEYHKERYKKEELGKVIWYAGGIMDWDNVMGHHRGVDELDFGQYDQFGDTELATGNCMCVRRDVFEKVGLFDERYFLYYEDADFSMRVKSWGFRIAFQPKATLWHKNAVSAGGSGSKLQDYYISRNRMLFGMTYAPFRSRIALLRESIKLLVNGREFQKKGIADFYLRRFGKGSYQ